MPTQPFFPDNSKSLETDQLNHQKIKKIASEVFSIINESDIRGTESYEWQRNRIINIYEQSLLRTAHWTMKETSALLQLIIMNFDNTLIQTLFDVCRLELAAIINILAGEFEIKHQYIRSKIAPFCVANVKESQPVFETDRGFLKTTIRKGMRFQEIDLDGGQIQVTVCATNDGEEFALRIRKLINKMKSKIAKILENSVNVEITKVKNICYEANFSSRTQQKDKKWANTFDRNETTTVVVHQFVMSIIEIALTTKNIIEAQARLLKNQNLKIYLIPFDTTLNGQQFRSAITIESEKDRDLIQLACRWQQLEIMIMMTAIPKEDQWERANKDDVFESRSKAKKLTSELINRMCMRRRTAFTSKETAKINRILDKLGKLQQDPERQEKWSKFAGFIRKNTDEFSWIPWITHPVGDQNELDFLLELSKETDSKNWAEMSANDVVESTWNSQSIESQAQSDTNNSSNGLSPIAAEAKSPTNSYSEESMTANSATKTPSSAKNSVDSPTDQNSIPCRWSTQYNKDRIRRARRIRIQQRRRISSLTFPEESRKSNNADHQKAPKDAIHPPIFYRQIGIYPNNDNIAEQEMGTDGSEASPIPTAEENEISDISSHFTSPATPDDNTNCSSVNSSAISQLNQSQRQPSSNKNTDNLQQSSNENIRKLLNDFKEMILSWDNKNMTFEETQFIRRMRINYSIYEDILEMIKREELRVAKNL